MFDIGFSELLVIAIITLIVMGPERLPQTVRSISLWIGRLKQMLASARRDFEQEVGMDEIRQQLHNEQVMRQLGETKDNLQQTLNNNPIKDVADDIMKPLVTDSATNRSSDNSQNDSKPTAAKNPADE
jgi:sec-independent protein translocase protein TatB